MAIFFAVWLLGFYPALFVNGRPVTVSRLNNQIEIASRFYAVQMKLQGDDGVVLKSAEAKTEVKKAALESLVVSSLIDRELGRRISGKDLAQMLENRLSGVSLDSENVEKGAELLYGLTVEELRQYILAPQAKLEILEGNFKAKEEDFQSWLAKAKKEAAVSIFVPGFAWKNGAVENN